MNGPALSYRDGRLIVDCSGESTLPGVSAWSNFPKAGKHSPIQALLASGSLMTQDRGLWRGQAAAGEVAIAIGVGCHAWQQIQQG